MGASFLCYEGPRNVSILLKMDVKSLLFHDCRAFLPIPSYEATSLCNFQIKIGILYNKECNLFALIRFYLRKIVFICGNLILFATNEIYLRKVQYICESPPSPTSQSKNLPNQDFPIKI